MYPIKKNRLPKKFTDTKIIQCMAKSVHDHFYVDNILLQISKEKYEMFFDYLEQEGIIKLITTKYTPEGYGVLDEVKYKKFLNKKEGKFEIKITSAILGVTLGYTK